VVAPEDAQRRRAIIARVREDFAAVLVHGDPSLIPLEASFPEASEIADRLVYTGYVGGSAGLAAADDGAGADEVLVSAGGGAVGGALMATALATRRLGCLAGLGWRLLTGPNMPVAQIAALSASLPDGVIVERYRPDFPQMLRRCRVSVSQAGYNTVLDILAARGVVEVVAPSALSPERLAEAIERAVRGRPSPLAVDMTGARRSAQLIAEMIGNVTTATRLFRVS
jgi:predicted glycosyltransferase